MRSRTRISVLIEAPREAMTEILRRHQNVRSLFDNGWLHLFALNDEGQMAWRYAGDLQWTEMGGVVSGTQEPRRKVDSDRDDRTVPARASA
jgi:uncharacterized protein YbcC (UPF0753/DUF2309 family)